MVPREHSMRMLLDSLYVCLFVFGILCDYYVYVPVNCGGLFNVFQSKTLFSFSYGVRVEFHTSHNTKSMKNVSVLYVYMEYTIVTKKHSFCI